MIQHFQGDSIVPFNSFKLPDSKKVSHMLQVDTINLLNFKILRFKDSKLQNSKFLGGDFIVPFNSFKLPDSKKVSNMLQVDAVNLFNFKILRFQDFTIQNSNIPNFQGGITLFHSIPLNFMIPKRYHTYCKQMQSIYSISRF